ncbi:DUF6510 family protein [Nocardioides albus]|uniref:Uncharacterized protein n=1 Tax=Nocardioides albus TaxID=1841 RepID=A0A7W5A6Z5_9ACTN|nr:DUF6510 family protein [Nocardioides albus]MBB3090841.1 hypothetical protein [Nocardioides albus]GGU37838.1 hypothetical protein GCM10007979_41150 [Nocardioides albus]
MHEDNDHRVDGNAAAGILREVFASDVTTARVVCGHCTAGTSVAETKTYLAGPGSILRCPGCDAILARITKIRDTVWLDLSGSASWQIHTG